MCCYVLCRQAKDVPADILRRFKIKMQKHQDFKEVWNSAGTMSRSDMSVWEPVLDHKISEYILQLIRASGRPDERETVIIVHREKRSLQTNAKL